MRKMTDEHKRKIVEARRKNNSYFQSKESRLKISLKLKGRKHTEQAIKNMSLAHMGLNKGKHWKLSEKTRKNMSNAKKGIPLSPEHRLKCIKNLIHTKGRKLTLEHRMSISESKKGEKSHFWKGGKSKQYAYKHITGIEYRLWREAVFSRDNWTCKNCGQVGGNLNAHHIKKWIEFPELRTSIENGITLCIKCHRKVHKK
jgi:hypothetical protein